MFMLKLQHGVYLWFSIGSACRSRDFRLQRWWTTVYDLQRYSVYLQKMVLPQVRQQMSEQFRSRRLELITFCSLECSSLNIWVPSLIPSLYVEFIQCVIGRAIRKCPIVVPIRSFDRDAWVWLFYFSFELLFYDINLNNWADSDLLAWLIERSDWYVTAYIWGQYPFTGRCDVSVAHKKFMYPRLRWIKAPESRRNWLGCHSRHSKNCLHIT